MTTRGIFITLEGIDGSGKSTQAQLLAQFLERQHRPCLLTREPGGTEGGEALRHLLKKSQRYHWTSLSQFFLFMAGRHMHMVHKVLPALQGGQWVICDRFIDSTYAYQGHFLKDVPWPVLAHMNIEAAAHVTPDLTLILDIEPLHAQHRITARHPLGATLDAYDALSLHDMTCLRERFLEVACHNPQRCRVISAEGSPQDVHHTVVQTLQEMLGTIG